MPFCSALYNSCYINHDKNLSPCCRFITKQRFCNAGESIIRYQQSNLLSEVKDSMLIQWHYGCQVCQYDEDMQVRSLRQNFNSFLSNKYDGIEYLDYNVSNTCNLTCRHCDNSKSSKWNDVANKNIELLDYDFWLSKRNVKKFSVREYFNDTDLSNLKYLKYTGGEPFISKSDLEELILFLDELNIIDQINFECHTNCSFYPKKIIPILSKFKSVKINFSIDGLFELTDYLRTGTEWYEIKDTIDSWLSLNNKKFNFQIHHTCYSLNAHQYDLIYRYSIDNEIKFRPCNLYRPKYLSLKVLPDDYKNDLISNGQVVNNYIVQLLKNTNFDQELFKKFVNYVKTTDKILGTDIYTIIPKLGKYIK